MKTDKEIQEKYDSITESLKGLKDGHFKTVFEAQQYILEWVMESKK